VHRGGQEGERESEWWGPTGDRFIPFRHSAEQPAGMGLRCPQPPRTFMKKGTVCSLRPCLLADQGMGAGPAVPWRRLPDTWAWLWGLQGSISFGIHAAWVQGPSPLLFWDAIIQFRMSLQSAEIRLNCVPHERQRTLEGRSPSSFQGDGAGRKWEKQGLAKDLGRDPPGLQRHRHKCLQLLPPTYTHRCLQGERGRGGVTGSWEPSSAPGS
jgi:hypothetical protein